MSCWTHITACLSVETYIEDTDVKSIVEKYLQNAPKITGSEGDADVFVNVQSGRNVWISCDCDHCKYKNSIEWLDDNTFNCSCPDAYHCPEAEYQTCVTITIQGDLRDRMKEQTKEEFEKFLAYIEDKYCVRDYAININWE